MTNMSPFALSGLLAATSSLLFGVLVFVKAADRRIGRTWLFFSLGVAGWGIGAIGIGMARTEADGALAWRLAYWFGVIWIAPLFFHFVQAFLSRQLNRSVFFHYLVAAAFIPLVPTSQFFSGFPLKFGSLYYAMSGTLVYPFLIWWCGIILYSHFVLLRAMRTVDGQKRNQIKYFMIATALGFIGGTSTYLADFGWEVYPWGNFTVCVYPLIMSYAIMKHQLMDIHIVLRRTFLYGVALAVSLTAYIALVVHFTRREVVPLTTISLITAVLSCLMSAFVLVKAPRRPLTYLWSLTCLSIGIWCAGFGMMSGAQTAESALFWQINFLYLGSILIPVLYLHFVSLLTGYQFPRVLRACYAAAACFEVINFSGHLATVLPKPPFAYYTDAIFPAYPLFTAYFFAIAIAAHYLLYRRLKSASGGLKNQIAYVFVGTAVGFLGGSTTFALCYDVQIFPIGTYLVGFYLLTVTYAIFKHQLMDINVVLRKSLVYSLMTIILTAVYLIVISQGTKLMQSMFGASTVMSTIIGAFVLSAGFLPLRNRVQAFVDRYFFIGWSDREMVREVAAGFSHELKSPLAGLSMQAQMALSELNDLEEGKLDLKEALPRMRQQLNYLLTQSMDAARRIEAVRGVAEPAEGQLGPVDVIVSLENALAMLDRRLAQAKIDVQRALPGNLPPAHSNEKQLEIVFINLIKNALDAMDGLRRPEAHRLRLGGASYNGSVQVTIRDTGPGIAAKDVTRIFEPYYTTKGRKGTGMGLYLTHQIIKAHGGSIDVHSEEGNGTEFIVRLPRYAAEGTVAA